MAPTPSILLHSRDLDTSSLAHDLSAALASLDLEGASGSLTVEPDPRGALRELETGRFNLVVADVRGLSGLRESRVARADTILLVEEESDAAADAARTHLVWDYLPLGAGPSLTAHLLRNWIRGTESSWEDLIHSGRGASTRVKEFARGTANDFNNVIHVISGHVNLLQRKVAALTTEGQSIQAIRKATQKAYQITHQIHGFLGEVEVDLVVLAAHEFLRDCREELEEDLPEGIDLVVEETGTNLEFEGDATRIREVVQILASNAVEAMAGRRGRLILRARTEAVSSRSDEPGSLDLEPGPYVCLEVQDDGPGVEPSVRDRIFDPFFSTREGRRGMGLATARGLIRIQGGFLDLVPGTSGGARFRILFPRAAGRPAQVDASPRIPAATGSPGEPETMDGPTGTILVVDDEELVLDLTEAILVRRGFQVLAASSGAEAIEIYREKKDVIDIVLLDLAMPRMSGEQTYTHLVRIDPDVKVILCTGYDPQTLVSLFQRVERVGYIQKPFQGRALVKMIREVLEAS